MPARARGGGRRGRRARRGVRPPRGDRGAQARAPRGRRSQPTCCRSRSTAATSCRPACRGSSATSSSVPQVVGDDWRSPARARPAAPARLRARRRDGAARSGATRRERDAAERAAADPVATDAARRPSGPARAAARRGTTSIIQSFNYAFEGSSGRCARSATCASTSRSPTVVLVLAFAYDVTKLELIALLLAIAFVLITEMINTAIEAATDIATTSFDPLAKLAKDIAAGAVLVATVTAVVIGYLVLADRLGEPTDRAPRRAPRRAGAPDAHRARGRDPRRDRGQGADRAGHAAARRASLRPRRARLRRLDGDHVRDRRASATASSCRPSPSSWPASWPRRGSSPASTRPSRSCSARRSASLVTLVLFQAFGSTPDRRASSSAQRGRAGRVRAVLGLPRRGGGARRDGASSRARTSRTPPTGSRSAPSAPRWREPSPRASRPGDVEAVAVTASPCGGVPPVAARVRRRSRRLPLERRARRARRRHELLPGLVPPLVR